MKKRYILFAVAALMLAACAKTVEQPEPEGVQITIRAIQEGATDTKTAVQDGGTQVNWEPNDEIKVFFKGAGSRFISQNSQNEAIAEFSGTMNVIVGVNEGASGSNDLWGLYPYRSDATSDGSSVTTTLPAEQTGRAGSFARNTHITLARSSSHDLAFYNVTGGVRFSLTQEGIKSVTFQGNGGETLAGRIKLAFDGGVPAVQEVTEGETVLTLNAPGGGTFETGKWYYIEAIPGTLSSGFKVAFSKGNETAKISSFGSVTINRGKYGSIADADQGLIFKGEGGDEPGGGEEPDPSSVIQFVDPIAKYACVEKFDANGDGEVSYAEAAAATSFVGLFKDWNTVTKFEEIKYFKGVTSTEGVFNGLTKLETITIPDFITTLGTFQGCTALTSVILPSELTAIPSYCFDGCTALTSVSLPSNLGSIPNYCFQGCTALQSLEVPASVTEIGTYVFSGCIALQTVALPSGLTTLKRNCFDGCTALTSVSLPYSLGSIPIYCFQGCSALQTIELPSELNTIGSYAFNNCKSINLLSFPSALTSIGNVAFRNCTSLAKIVLGGGVSIGQHAFSGCTALFSITMGDSVSLGSYAFQNCSALPSISLGDSVTISSDAFSGCTSLSSVSMGKGGSISSAFSGCTSLSTVTLGEGVIVSENAFSGCTALTTVVLPPDMTAIPSGLFGSCTVLKTITWPSALQSIGNSAFYGCVISKDDPDASVIELPSTVKSIGSQAFWGVRHLKMPSTSAISIEPDAFYSGVTRLYVPAEMVEMYKVRTNWSVYANQIYPIGDYPVKPSFPVAEAVDLGLSVKWASWNVGAYAPEGNGCYFAWGEVEDKVFYDWSTYKWCDGSYSTLTKYNNNSSYGTVDNKTALDPEDDAAHVNWGGSWRMPTDAEWTELRYNCTWTWTTQNGVNGRLVTSNKEGYTDKSIFLPAAGSRNGYYLYDAGTRGNCWSSSLYTGSPYGAYFVYFYSGYHRYDTNNRNNGFSVRPVTE